MKTHGLPSRSSTAIAVRTGFGFFTGFDDRPAAEAPFSPRAISSRGSIGSSSMM
jgi:hypothetical protein